MKATDLWHHSDPNLIRIGDNAMKPSHLQAPRQLADATFTVGHAQAHPMPHRDVDVVIYCILAFVIGAMLGGLL